MQRRYRFRPAIAMIELIFALVVMGITLLSVPLVVNQSIRSSTVAMQQEAIAAAASQLSLILTQKWDAFDSNATAPSGILNVTQGAAALALGARDLNTTYSTRRFNIQAGFTNATTPANLGQELGVDYDDVDDFDNKNMTLTLYGAENESLSNNKGEYADTTLVMQNTVRYGLDNAPNYANSPVVFNFPFTSTAAGSTNIKLVSVTLTSGSNVDELNKEVSLSAFTCNIGTARPNITTLP